LTIENLMLKLGEPNFKEKNMGELSQSIEDYLETIYLLSLHRKVVRVNEIAKKLSVKMASVTGILKNLVDKGFVQHERYGYVELTEEGEKIGKNVYARHKTLRKFLAEILLVKPQRAEKDACQLEHYLSPETFERFVKFIDFVQTCPVKEPVWLSGLHQYLEEGKRPDCRMEGEDMEDIIKLSELKVGEKGMVKKLTGDKAISSRLLQMGIVSGTEILVERVAPLGDPIEVTVKGYHLSLRKEEAKNILMERTK